MVGQPECGTNTSYLIDFIEICFQAKLINSDEIRSLYLERGLSANQIARKFGVAKSVILKRLHEMNIRLASISGSRMTNPENYLGRVPPYGYSIVSGKLAINKRELRICRFVVQSRKESGRTFSATAKELGKSGYKNRMGREVWDHKTVKNIFERWKDKL